MALKGNFTYCGISIPDSYVRIEYIHGDKYRGWKAQATVYKDLNSSKPDAEGNLPQAIQSVWVYAHPEGAPVVDAYEVLYDIAKALPEFNTFTDA